MPTHTETLPTPDDDGDETPQAPLGSESIDRWIADAYNDALHRDADEGPTAPRAARCFIADAVNYGRARGIAVHAILIALSDAVDEVAATLPALTGGDVALLVEGHPALAPLADIPGITRDTPESEAE